MIKALKTTILFLTVLATVQSCRVTYKSSELFQNKESEELFKQAQAFQFKGQLDSAIVYFDKADNSAPYTALILHERGLLKSNMKKYDEALIDLDKSIELTTDQRQKEIRISNRALTYLEMGKMTEACNDWRNSGKWGKSYIEKYCK
jgi:tetratricopeptide (TPR) repeat protein